MAAHAWCEINRGHLEANFNALQRLAGATCAIAPVVKANAYGHGMVAVAQILTGCGARWLCVHDVDEATRLRQAGICCEILILGPVVPEEAQQVVQCKAHVTVSDRQTRDALDAAGRLAGTSVPIHLKMETGINRQGLHPEEILEFCQETALCSGLRLMGVATHFADGDDTQPQSYMRVQTQRFHQGETILENHRFRTDLRHCANSTSFLLWPDVRFDLARVGIALYGLWPSHATQLTHRLRDRGDIRLQPVLSWKTRIAQVKTARAGEPVGYGCSEYLTRDSRLAVLPVGYYDGYARLLSHRAHVLIRGRHAPVRGVVMMNLTVVDVTDIGEAASGEEVVLLGTQGQESISAEQHAQWTETIHYEVTTRIREGLPRHIC